MVVTKLTTDRLILGDHVMRKFAFKKVFNDHSTRCDISMRGRTMLTTSSDHKITIWDTYTGTRKSDILSKKYGCGLIQCVASSSGHDAQKAVHSSTVNNDALRLLDLKRETYDSYFEGHTDKVTSLETTSTKMFMSGARDNTVSVWDYRSPHRQGLLHTPGGSRDVLLSIDPLDGRVFAVIQHNHDVVKVYDAPFLTFNTTTTTTSPMSVPRQLQFTPNGRSLALTYMDRTEVFDSFTGVRQHTYHTSPETMASNAEHDHFLPHSTYSPDGHYLLTSTAEQGVVVSSAQQPSRVVCTVRSTADRAQNCPTRVAFSEQMALIVMTGNRVLFAGTESDED